MDKKEWLIVRNGFLFLCNFFDNHGYKVDDLLERAANKAMGGKGRGGVDIVGLDSSGLEVRYNESCHCHPDWRRDYISWDTLIKQIDIIYKKETKNV